MWRYLSSWLPFQQAGPSPPPSVDLPPAKVAIIGAGMGGCFAAKFLRENGGDNLEIHVWAKKGSKVGGRSATDQIGDHVYEVGASIMHTRNKYLSGALEEFGLKKKGEESSNTPLGIYDGHSFLLRTGSFSIVNSIKLFWRYGFSLLKVDRSVSSLLNKFDKIYDIQRGGQAFANVEDMLSAMDEEMTGMTQVSADDYFLNHLHWDKRLVDELITGAFRVNYGQGGTALNAFTGFVSLAGMEDGKLWSVIGGNWQIAEKVLEASGANLVMDDVVRVTKVEDENGQRKYVITTEDGTETGDFDVVVVANPLNISSIKYENFSDEVYTAAATSPYHRTVATITCAKINQEFFGVSPEESNFPLDILTTSMEGPPFAFNSVGLLIPSEISEEDVKEYIKPLSDQPKRMWKVFSPEPLTERQLDSMFSDMSDTVVHDWLAYPQYRSPESFPSFVLDDGVYYINAIEKAASAMEMSVIAAKNAALLAKEYILNQHHPDT